jgi:outer membrane autotransporter protein
VTAGADYRLNENWALGGLVSYGHTYAKTDDAGSQTQVDSYSPGIYAAYADQGWFANGFFSYDYNQYNESRVITFLNRTANGRPYGDQFNGNLDGGYEFHSGKLTFGPTAALQFAHLDINSFTETNAGAADLAVNDQQVDSLRSRLGGEVRYNWQWYGGKVTATPHFSASWQHEYLDNSNGITSQFAGQGLGAFTVNQSTIQRDSALVDTGLDVRWNDAFSTFIDYQAQAGQSNFFAESIQAGLKIDF